MPSIDIKDFDAVRTPIATAADEGNPTLHNPVHTLPPTILTALLNTASRLLTLANTVTSNRVAVDLTTTINTAIANILAALLPASAGFKADQNNDIDTGADRTFASQALVKGMLVTNISTASQSLYLSHATGPTATNSYVLGPGLSVWVPCTNANQLLMRPSADNAAACYLGE